MIFHRSIELPVREFIDMDHRWRDEDNGIIWCWERGREISQEKPDLAKRARAGGLMVLAWKGGVPENFKGKKKEGTYNYLAQWQGLAGKDLDIDTEVSVTLTCSTTGVEVTYSKDGWKTENQNLERFIALDFETANAARASICSIGLVFFQDNQIVEEKYYLINPQEEFRDFNIHIHGITPEHVIQSPTFPQIEVELRSILTGETVVSHSEFDLQVLSNALKKHKLPPIDFSWINSCEIARDLFPDLRNHKLKTIAKRLKAPLNHHNALDDARVAGMIIVEANKKLLGRKP